MIIDCHCHAGKGDGLTGPWDTSAPLKDYLVRAARAGIERTVLFPAFHSDYALANREVARIVARQPDRFYGFAFIHADRDRGRVRELVGVAVEKYGFTGIKVHRYDARISREICETARVYGLPILYDPVAEVAIAELLAVEYPEVNFIFAHLGSFSDDWRAQTALIDSLSRHPNIYSDTSGVRRFDIPRAGAPKSRSGEAALWVGRALAAPRCRVGEGAGARVGRCRPEAHSWRQPGAVDGSQAEITARLGCRFPARVRRGSFVIPGQEKCRRRSTAETPGCAAHLQGAGGDA